MIVAKPNALFHMVTSIGPQMQLVISSHLKRRCDDRLNQCHPALRSHRPHAVFNNDEEMTMLLSLAVDVAVDFSNFRELTILPRDQTPHTGVLLCSRIFPDQTGEKFKQAVCETRVMISIPATPTGNIILAPPPKTRPGHGDCTKPMAMLDDHHMNRSNRGSTLPMELMNNHAYELNARSTGTGTPVVSTIHPRAPRALIESSPRDTEPINSMCPPMLPTMEE